MDWHWIGEQAWWILKACAVLGAVGKWMLKQFKNIAEETYRECNATTIELFNTELKKRDTKLWHLDRRITTLTYATKQFAAVALYPTVPPSQAEKNRIMEDIDRVNRAESDFQIP